MVCSAKLVHAICRCHVAASASSGEARKAGRTVRIWLQDYVVFTQHSGRVAYPPLRDVAIREDESFAAVWMIADNGYLWHQSKTPYPPDTAGQVPNPGDLARLAVALDDSVWCMTTAGAVWHRRVDGSWQHVPEFLGPLADITIRRGSVWVAREDGAVFETTDGMSYIDRTSLVPFQRLGGSEHGQLWGIDQQGHLWFRTSGDFWEPTQGIGISREWADVSVSFEGTAYLVGVDGTVSSTTDGILYEGLDGAGFSSFAAGRFLEHYAVKQDGTLWLWDPAPATPPPAPPPVPVPTPPVAPPPPTAARPVLRVTTTGGGGSTVFHVTGSDFMPGATATVRGARIDDGTIINVFWQTPVKGDRTIGIDIPLPCLSGLTIDFSAQDGRPDPSDLLDLFWSNTVAATCP